MARRVSHRARRNHKLRNKARAKWEAVISTYGSKCYYCHKMDADTLDHYIPLVKGGDNDVSNLRPACSECNRKKGDRMPEVAPEEGGAADG